MKEKLYSIPVNDAFHTDCECPICQMHKTLEEDAVDYTMGPSYMEDDTRAMTDAAGFCEKHVRMIYEKENRLGMAWVMKTHFEKTIEDIRKLTKSGIAKEIKKDPDKTPLIRYLDKLNRSCFVCDRIRNFFYRYIDTLFCLWESDPAFKALYQSCKGFCTLHYDFLLRISPEYLKGDALKEFIDQTNELYLKNMERVKDDLSWFINKFDYKYQDEPWYHAKDSVVRSMTKANGVILSDR